MIDVSSIPDFSGDLDQLEKDAGTLKKAASDIRTTGGDVHSKFQGLHSCYTAPEADKLFATTLPVRDGADKFAGKLESVSSALSAFASEARPLVSRMADLKSQAETFCKSVEGKHDWQKDQSKVDKNAGLIHEVGRVWGQFQEAERKAAGKISDVAGTGTKWTVDDGSHKKGMYGFSADDAAKADDTPWGKVDKRKYEGLEAAWHWTTDHVGSALKGFFVDGVWGTLTGLGHMVNVFDWDTFKKTWSGIGDVFGGVSAYIMTPYDWAMDKMFGPVDHSDTDRQKKALRDFGKSLVAWDEWGKNPTRAGGTVAFNLLTLGSGSLLKLGKAGSLAAKAGEVGDAGKLGTAAKVANALGKTGRLVDPMTYVGKAGEFVKLQVGDLMSGMKNVYKGTYTDFLNGTGKYSMPKPEIKIPDTSVKMPDGTIVHHNGKMELPDGTPSQKPIPVEKPAAERAAQHPAPAHERVPAGVGAGHGGGDHPAPKPGPKPGPPPGGGGGGGHVPPTGGHGGGGHGGGGDHGGGGHDGGGHGGGDHGGGHGGGGTPPPPHEGGTYNPGPDDKVPHLQRQDDNFAAEHNRKGQRKAHLNADGDLVPADPNGDASIVDHIVGRDPKKSESPYTSLSEDGADAKDYGGKKIRVDLPNLAKDIADGKVKGVEVYSPKEVEAAIQQSADKIAGEHVNIDVPPGTSYDDISKRAAEMAKEHGWGKAKTKRIEQRIKDMMHTRRDSEWLIKGVVPHEYIHEAS